MRRRFRKPKGGEGTDSGAPEGPDGPDGSGGGGGAAFDRLLERQLDERADVAVLDNGPDIGPDNEPVIGPDIGADAGSDSGPDAGPYVGPGTGFDTGADYGADYGADTRFGAGVGVGRDTDGADYGADTGFGAGLGVGCDTDGADTGLDAGLGVGCDTDGADTGFGAGVGVGRDTDGAARTVGRPPAGGGDFWDLYDQAAAEAALASVTPAPASVVAVVGPLDAAMSVARRQTGPRHVHVLTERRDLPAGCTGLDWTRVERPSDLVAVLDQAADPDEAHRGPPILVLDVPSELPAFVEPLVARLRQCGLELVHYILDGDPDDEDLATWYGRLGRPSVLDLVAPIEPARILELIDRGEPVVSVAGMPLTPELLLAFRLELVGGP